ncbi:MAG: PsbP-related protein [archaeon]|jgi:hypothetical protein|nr:PsbP-related protein [archaeon]
MKQAIFICLILIAILLSGCVQEEDQLAANGENIYAGEGFSIKYPANWSKATDTPAGAIFVPEDEMTVLMVSKLNGIEGETAGSLDELIEQLLSPLKETGTFSLTEDSLNFLDGTEAKDITFTFEEEKEGKTVYTRIVAVEKDDMFYLLALSGCNSKQQFNRDLPLFEASVTSFKFQEVANK